MRIGHPVKHQQQRWPFHAVEQIVQRVNLGNRGHHGHHTLMTMTPSQFGQAQTIGFNQAHARITGFVDELPHAGIAARDLVVDFNNGLGGDLEANAHGMKAEQHFMG